MDQKSLDSGFHGDKELHSQNPEDDEDDDSSDSDDEGETSVSKKPEKARWTSEEVISCDNFICLTTTIRMLY